ncbi:unnamed protein product [Victoria cruziana]
MMDPSRTRFSYKSMRMAASLPGNYLSRLSQWNTYLLALHNGISCRFGLIPTTQQKFPFQALEVLLQSVSFGFQSQYLNTRKISSGKLKLEMKEWRCSGICNSVDRMKDDHQ